jgi:hypothetical protein
MTAEEQTPCGETVKKGNWIVATTQAFVAQVFGFLDPKVAWKVNGQSLLASSGDLVVHRGELSLDLRYGIDPGGRTLTLFSAGGDTFAVGVEASASDVLGNAAADDDAFEVSGRHAGYRPEDLGTIVRCLARKAIGEPTIIWPTLPTLDGPRPEELEEWAARQRAVIAQNPNIPDPERDSVQRLIDLQVYEPTARNILHDPARIQVRFRNRIR